MPMPPQKPSGEGQRNPRSGEGQRNPRRRREFEQIERVLKDQGPSDADTIKRLVGGTYWQAGRFDKALSWGLQKKLVVREDDGRYRLAAPGSS